MKKHVLILMSATLFIGGCASPTATIDLINVAKKALQQAGEEKQVMYEQQQKMYRSQITALDDGFDADVKMIAAGGIKTAEGETVTLTPEWIISARQGYSAARAAIETQMLAAEKNNMIEQDNLKVGIESLDMAQELEIMQWNIAEAFKVQFKKLTERNDNGQ